jgi:predicted DsbA family dithiol-disulfide isomerase
MDPAAPEVMTVEVWADVVCPWCQLGKAYLESAIGQFEHAGNVEVVWRSFELDPGAPAVREGTLTDHLMSKLGRSAEQVDELHAMICQRGSDVGVDFQFDVAKPGNSFDAHRLLHLAKDRGRQAELADALFTGYFTEGQPIGDPEALERIAVSAGLEPAEVASVLESDRYASDVRADEAQAQAFGVSGVPFFVFDRRVAASGAQPPEVLLGGLQQAWAARND